MLLSAAKKGGGEGTQSQQELGVERKDEERTIWEGSHRLQMRRGKGEPVSPGSSYGSGPAFCPKTHMGGACVCVRVCMDTHTYSQTRALHSREQNS